MLILPEEDVRRKGRKIKAGTAGTQENEESRGARMTIPFFRDFPFL